MGAKIEDFPEGEVVAYTRDPHTVQAVVSYVPEAGYTEWLRGHAYGESKMKELVRFKKLTFTPTGTVLLHSSSKMVTVWNTVSSRLRYTCPGSLVGISHDGETFLTRHTADSFSVWEINTGTELALEHVVPETFQLYQRIIALADQQQLSLQIRDVFDAHSFPMIQIPRTPSEASSEASIENWRMAPNDQYIATVIGGSAGGFDWSRGYCIDLDSGRPVFEFEANPYLRPAPIYFSAEHWFLISGGAGYFWLYEFRKDFPCRKITLSSDNHYIPQSGGSIVSVSPKNKWLVAVNSTDPARNLLSGIQLADVSQSFAEVKRTIRESVPIVDIQFHPDGEHIASLLNNGEIHIWDTITGDLAAVFLRGNEVA